MAKTVLESKPTVIPSKIRRLTAEHVEEGAKLLSKAFTGYPVANYMFEGLDDGPERFRVMFEYLINSRIVRKWPVFGCFLENRLVGVAVVSEPGEEVDTPELDAQWDRAQNTMGERAMSRFFEYGDACDEGLPKWPHHYLGILGVGPEYQSNGYGRLLVEEVKREAQRHPASKGVCLNTETSKNVPFYASLGFDTVDFRPVDWIHTWCMAWQSE